MDVGMKRVGLALSDPSRSMCFPHTTLVRAPISALLSQDQRTRRLAEQLSKEVLEQHVVGVVVGIPLLNGLPTSQTRLVAELTRALVKESSTLSALPLTYWDESHSTSEARVLAKMSSSKRAVFSTRRDELAAVVILQDFLASR